MFVTSMLHRKQRKGLYNNNIYIELRLMSVHAAPWVDSETEGKTRKELKNFTDRIGMQLAYGVILVASKLGLGYQMCMVSYITAPFLHH